MANEVILKVRVLNKALAVQPNRPVLLLNPDTDANPFAPNPTVVVASGNTDSDGYAEFTSVAEGTYDIKIVNASGNSIFNYGYIVKNSYVVDPGGSAQAAESRFAVRSGEHIQGVSAGILARTSDAQGGVYSSYTFSKNPVVGNGVIVGTQPTANLIGGNTGTSTPTYYQNQIDGTDFSVPTTLRGKASGNSYYHDNQNLTLSQKIDIVIGG